MEDQAAFSVTPPAVAAIPPSIVKAICTIKASMDAVKKTGKNPHGGYMFASTDDVYAALARKMGEVGLTCIALEDHEPRIERIERDGKVSQWAKVAYSFVLATEEATWFDPRSRRTLFIQVTGPQTFQAAQSYCEKSYYRSLFTIPTGDMDLDAMAQADTEEDQVALTQPKKRKSSYAAKKDGKTTEQFNEIKQAIETAANVDLLMQIKTLYAEEIAELPAQWASLIEDTYVDRMETLQMAQREAAE